MKSLLQKSRIQYLIHTRNGFLALASGSMLMNVFLIFVMFIMMGKERIVIVPPEINKSFWVDASHVSPEYLSEMSLFLTSIRFNLTPSNAEIQRQLLLRYVDPNHYEKIKSELMEEEEQLKKDHISLAFFVSDIKVDANKLVSRISGDLQYSVGDSLLPRQHVNYQVAYSYNAGRLLIKTFDEVKSNA